MKKHRVVPSKAPMTSIKVNGVPFHYFHSDKLGSCRAILISPDENLAVTLPTAPASAAQSVTHSPTAAKAEKSHVDLVNEEIDLYEQELRKKAKKPQKNILSKGQKLENLMNTSERLGKRIDRYLKNWREASDYESKVYWREKTYAAEKANGRVIRKMTEMLGAD
jgi:N-acetylmuramoyl-L-alanine amidase CwlA